MIKFDRPGMIGMLVIVPLSLAPRIKVISLSAGTIYHYLPIL